MRYSSMEENLIRSKTLVMDSVLKVAVRRYFRISSSTTFMLTPYAYMVDVFGGPYGGSRIYKANVDAFWTIPAPSGDPALEKDWEIVATHRMPSGRTETYRSKVLMRDYRGFATGTHYVR